MPIVTLVLLVIVVALLLALLIKTSKVVSPMLDSRLDAFEKAQTAGQLGHIERTMLFVVLILCSVAFGQAAPQQTADKKPLTNSDIIMMVKAGLAESTILTALDQNYLALDTSPAALVEAKNQGVSPTIIESMIRANAPAPDQQPESSPEVAPQQQAPPPQTQAPLPGPRLTDAQVTQAIARGNGKRHRIGLTLIDQQTAFFSAMACTTCGQTGYIITIYTPEHWIELGAERAKGEMLPFGLPEITEDM
ncbi:MAG: hypothetical protein LAO23_20385, partial [Acidobacteriia bacterium]|nr:hypothetical protein [Terriglobia bacterium]